MSQLLKILIVIMAAMFTFGCTHMRSCDNCNDPPATAANTNTNEKSHQLVADSAITTAVKSKLIEKKVFTKEDISAMSIHVETTIGVVYLSGNANNHTQIRNAVRVAKSVKGVKNVKSNIMIAKRQ